MTEIIPDWIDIEKCMIKKGLDFKYYKNVAKHLSNTLEDDQMVDICRFEEDLRKMVEMFKICGEGTLKKKYIKIYDLIFPQGKCKT